MKIQRREFIAGGVSATLAAMLGPDLVAANVKDIEDSSGVLPRRALGKTGEKLSIVGLGGLSLMRGTQQETNELVAEAVDRGVNYFDVAPAYGRGKAEEMLGPALKPYRDKSFLACKTKMRDKKGALEELERSLMRLKTDHFDLYQLHFIADVDKDVKTALGSDGAMETFLEAREKGMVRYLGFSSHTVEAAMAAMESKLFDTILLPVNYRSHFQGNKFDRAPLREASRQKMGLLAIKPGARAKWESKERRKEVYPGCWYEPIQDPVEAALALRWTLGRGVTAALPPGFPDFFRMALNVASKDKPLEPKELKALKQTAKELPPLFATEYEAPKA